MALALAARKAVDRRIGKGQGELELGNGPPKHVKGDRRACFDFRKALAEEFAVGLAAVQPVQDLGPNRVVVAGKIKTRGFRALGRRNKGLRNKQMRLVGK